MDRFETHLLKVEQPYFDALASGDKTFEVRRNDRAYQRGDLLLLTEWHAQPSRQSECWDCRRAATDRAGGHYTKQQIRAWVRYVYAGDPRWPDTLGAGVVVLALAFEKAGSALPGDPA